MQSTVGRSPQQATLLVNTQVLKFHLYSPDGASDRNQ